MVDALRSAREVLRPSGRVVLLSPVNGYRPTIVIRRGRRTVRVGPIVRKRDADVAAAERASRSVVRAGHLAVTRSVRPRWVSTYADLVEVDETLAESENWRLPALTRRRIKREWRDGDSLEIARRFSVTVLRRR